MIRRVLAASGLLLAACGGTEEAPPSLFVDGFTPAAVREGFTRYVTPPVRAIPPGTDETYCQWLTEAFDHDVDIVAAEGSQTKGGHHLVLYATTLRAPVGTTRPCSNADQVSLRYLGAIGGEGLTGAENELPEGVVYRLPAGWALMANVHYVNYYASPLDGQSVIDVQQKAADPEARVASLFASTIVDQLQIAPGEQSVEISCEMQEDVPLILAGNHMHERGKSVRSQVRRTDGSTVLIRDDPIWSPESVFAPAMIRYDDKDPMIMRRGDVLETRCTWDNETGAPLGFPTEMCVTFGFYLGSGVQINCVSGTWEK